MRLLALPALAALLLAACAHESGQAGPTQPAQPAAVQPAPLAGGYAAAGPVDLSDAGVRAAYDLALAEVYKRFPQRGRAEAATVATQVVAGLNYRFVFTMTGGKTYAATVYRDLKGALSVTAVGEG